MNAYPSAISLPEHIRRIQVLCAETKRLETLCSTQHIGRELLQSIAFVLREIEAQSYLIRQTIQTHKLHLRTLVEEAILQVDLYVGETKDALISALTYRATAYEEIGTKLCFLSVALDELKNALDSTESIPGKSTRLELLQDLTEMDLSALLILQSMN